ncbi:YwqJ-related putative deaminase, partial [Streptomyces sp. NPDC000151]|uniref:YwqJ-related putative deaminase n=1 Tax=Streptomyces sp. NPDC000151 TaxID=3154244 RepID=UPI003326201E
IVDGIWGTIKGLGTLVGFGGWDAMGQAWKGLAQLATGLAISTIPGVGTAFWALPDDKLPSWLRDSRTAMKETGKALVAWDEWGKNPGRAAGAVTFNVLTTVFTGGAGGAAAGAGKAGAVAKALSVAGKAGKVIDPMTYVAKGAGAGLSKIGDIAKSIKGIGKVDVPALPADAIKLPEGSLKLPDGTVHLPKGAAIPEGATKLPDGNVRLPDDVPALPENATKLPTNPGEPARYFDGEGNVLDQHGNVLDHADNAPREGSPDVHPATGADTPRVETPAHAQQPVLVGAGAHVGDNAGQAIHVGNSLDSHLGDAGRIGDGAPGGGIGDRLQEGNAGNRLPDGHAGDLNHGPSTGQEPATSHSTGHGEGSGGNHADSAGVGHRNHPGGADGDAPHGAHEPGSASHHHGDDGAHIGTHDVHESHGGTHADDGAPTDVAHGDDGNGSGGPHHGGGSGSGPQGTPLEPQPDWHGQSADKMRHHRRPALDVSHLSPEDQLSVLERESAALADDAVNATPGAAPPGQNSLSSGCAGSFLHDNTVTAHSSTTKMHGQKSPNTHQVLDDILKEVGEKLDATPGAKRGLGHGKCAEISLISDRLRQLDPAGTSIRTIDDAKKALEGGLMHTRQIGDLYDRDTGALARAHGDYLAPCNTCEHVLPKLGIHVHS